VSAKTILPIGRNGQWKGVVNYSELEAKFNLLDKLGE